MNKSTQLRELLNSGETLVMPDAYNSISARVIEHSGFEAIQCSGFSMSIADCYSAEADLSLQANVAITGRIAGSVEVPVMADGEDGYGGPEAVQRTVSEFIDAGAAGMNIEDLAPSHACECRIVDPTLMVEKLLAAREAAVAKGDYDFIINARTDALRAFTNRNEGLHEAIARANRYLNAGVDLAFICYTATLEEAKTLVREVHGPISIAAGQPYNIREFCIDDLRMLGIARVSLPTLAIMSAIEATAKALSLIMEPDGFSRIIEEGLCASRETLAELLRS